MFRSEGVQLALRIKPRNQDSKSSWTLCPFLVSSPCGMKAVTNNSKVLPPQPHDWKAEAVPRVWFPLERFQWSLLSHLSSHEQKSVTRTGRGFTG